MSVATMPSPRKNDEKSDPKKGAKRYTLNVSAGSHAIINKVAAHRGKSVEELFDMEDVEDFFKHLLLEEMKKEQARLQGKK